jgi:hypothetical protein
VRAADGGVELAQGAQGSDREVGLGETASGVTRCHERSVAASVADAVRRLVVVPAVVLVQVSCRTHHEVGSSDGSAGRVVEVHLDVDGYPRQLVEESQRRLPDGLRPWIRVLHSGTESAYAGPARRQDRAEAGTRDVARGEGRLDHADKIEHPEIAGAPQQDFLGSIDRLAGSAEPVGHGRQPGAHKSSPSRSLRARRRRKYGYVLGQLGKPPVGQQSRRDVGEDGVLREHEAPSLELPQQFGPVLEVIVLAQVQPVAHPPPPGHGGESSTNRKVTRHAPSSTVHELSIRPPFSGLWRARVASACGRAWFGHKAWVSGHKTAGFGPKPEGRPASRRSAT